MNSTILHFTRIIISILMNAIVVETFSKFVRKMLNCKRMIRIENRLVKLHELTNVMLWYLNDILQHTPALVSWFIQLMQIKSSLFVQKCYQTELASGNYFFLSKIREKLHLHLDFWMQVWTNSNIFISIVVVRSCAVSFLWENFA